jgi:hypothetical protein
MWLYCTVTLFAGEIEDKYRKPSYTSDYEGLTLKLRPEWTARC